MRFIEWRGNHVNDENERGFDGGPSRVGRFLAVLYRWWITAYKRSVQVAP